MDERASGVARTEVTLQSNAVVAELLNLAKLQAKDETEYSAADELKLRYIGAAILAAERYTDRDILRRSYKLAWYGKPELRIAKGKVEELDVLNTSTPPVSVISDFVEIGDRSFEGNVTLYPKNEVYPVWPEDPSYSVVFKTGFAAAKDVPDSIIVYVLAAYAAFDANRELFAAGGGSELSIFPTALLDPITPSVIA